MKAIQLRKLFNEKGLIRILGAHNGLTAKLVEEAGFDAVWASGLEISASHGVPDANILSMKHHLDAATVMNDSIDLPLIADCDTGFGNSNNVIHMVKKFEAAGIAGVCIEDKKFPKTNSLLADGKQELAPIHEFVGKIMAAKNAQKSKDFMVFARVEALIAGWGVEEALKRAHTYVSAGADGIFIHSKSRSPKEIIEFIKRWDNSAPLIICPTTYPSLIEKEMEELGVKMVIYANHGIRASIKAVKDILFKIKEEGIINIDEKIVPLEEVFRLQGIHQMKENEKKYLMKENIKVIIPAAGETEKPSLKMLLQDMPLTMLDINGKPILQRNIEILKSCGIDDIYVIGGKNSDKLNIEGIKLIQNNDYETTYILDSIMKAKDVLDGKTLIINSDILFEKDIINKLLKSEGDIVLVVDSSYRDSGFRQEKIRDKGVTMVKAKYDPKKGHRIIRPERLNPILKIGKYIDLKEANHEYIGAALFSAKGIKDLKKAYAQEKINYVDGKFYEAESFDKADISDLFQKMIEKGYNISSLEINKGWLEVYTLEDYKKACYFLKGH